MDKQLLSARFARERVGQAVVPVSPQQQAYCDEFQQLAAAGRYEFVGDACCCGKSSCEGDVCVAEVDRYGLPLNSVLCRACGTVRTDPYLNNVSLDDFYARLYQGLYARQTNLPELFARQRNGYGTRIARHYSGALASGSAVLEIGCGTGGALIPFQELGCLAAGCDYSEELIRYGHSQGNLNTWTGTIESASQDVAAQSYDLIYLFHVLEHVARPDNLLAELRCWLKPGGRLLAVVPDLSQIAVHRNPAGDALKFLHVAHKFNFSRIGLARLAASEQLAATIVDPPARDRGALSDAEDLAELWMEFTPCAGASVSMTEFTGNQTLSYLLQTEHDFLAGQCAAQRMIAARLQLAAEPKLPPTARSPRWYDRLTPPRWRKYFSGRRAA